MNEQPAEASVLAKAPRDRSPSFPFIDLASAVDRLVSFEGKFGRHPTPANKVGLAWGMKEASSQAAQTLAAMKSFGLVDYQGSGPSRLASITDEGRNFLRAQQDSVKREILKRVALKPKVIAGYWQLWGAKRPIDPICLDELVLKANFTQGAAETFLRVYDATVAYAGLTDSDMDEASGDEAGDLNDEPIAIGDLVQVEVNGSMQFPEGVRVRAIQSHDGKPFIFVDGEITGFPMESVTLERKGETPKPLAPTLDLPEDGRAVIRKGWKEERLIDDEGGEIFISYQGDPSVARYEFIRDYLDFKVKRSKKP